MIKLSWRRFLVMGFLGIWAAVSLVAIGAMYKLWWQRERVAYLGVNVKTQRETVWNQAGLSDGLLALLPSLEAWPQDISYSIHGDINRQSYLKYLLLPRIPRGSEQFSVDVDSLRIQGTSTSNASTIAKQPKPILAPFFSLLILSGITLLVRKIVRKSGLSIPESFSLSCLLVMMVVVASKTIFQQAIPGFVTLLGIGCLGWLLFIATWLQESRQKQDCGCMPSKKWLFAAWPFMRANKWEVFFSLLLAASLLWSVLMSVVVVPDDWDAWAIWGAKAKALALTVGPLQDVTYFGHGDYPLLWPAVWALSGWCGGGWEEMGSRIWGPVFMMFCSWELMHIVWRRSSYRWPALLAGALFASIPMVPLVASWSYAEAPFWLITLCSYGCLSRWRETGDQREVMFAALLAVAAALTKNEGLLFVLLVILWIPATGHPVRFRALGLFIAVIVCFYLPWMYWVKIQLSITSHATEGLRLSWDTLSRAGERLPTALEVIGRMWADPRQWNVVLWGLAVSVFLSLWQSDRREDFLLPLGMLLAYCIIVVFHTADIYWQVGTSWNRLTLQVVPLTLAIVVPRMVHPVSQWLR